MIKNEFYNKHGNSRDMSRIELGRMVTNLRKELKEQIEENKELNDSITWWKNRYEAQVKINEEHQKINGELRKENDALITIIDLAKHKIKEQMPVYIMPNNMLIHGTEKAKFLEDLLEILERVNEE